VPRLSIGMECTLSTALAPLGGLPSDPCQLDAHCTGDGTASGISYCVAYATVGAACDSANSCDALSCVNGTCAQSLTGVDCGD
jgi:hypothetical protein